MQCHDRTGQGAAKRTEIDRIDLATDPRPKKLVEALARTVSVHSVATGVMEAEPWDFLAVYYDGLDVAGHDFGAALFTVFFPHHQGMSR